MLELIQGEGGINIADKDFVFSLRKLCDGKKLLLMVDEVQTGIGRTGTMFCWQNYGIVPDVFTLAKSLGGGLPIGVMMAKKEYAGLLSPGTHASTFGGGPVVCKAALAVLTAVQKEKLLHGCKETGAYLTEKMKELQKKYEAIKDGRSMGLMCGVELRKPGKPVVEACARKGLLINCTHETVLRIMPALNVARKQITTAACIFDAALGEAAL